MLSYLRTISRQIPALSQLFMPQYNAIPHRLPHLAALRRHITTRKWEFSDDGQGIAGVYHHTVKAEPQDREKHKISSVINDLISAHQDSLFFLTEKTRLLRRNSEDNPNNYIPLQKDEMRDLDFMLSLAKKKHWLKPHPGHTCMAITDDMGKILENTHVSLRSTSERVISGKSALHPRLYPAPLPGSVSIAKHTTIEEEIKLLAEKMLRDNRVTADLTIIPIGQTRVQLEDLLQNIQSARAIKLYNLFSLIVKKKEIEDITEKDIRSYVEELKKHADEFPALRDNADSETDSVLAALACTHAIAKATFGDSYAVDRETLPDQDTQTAVVYCTIALVGTRNFLNFAHKINFFDATSNLTKKQ